MIVAETGDGYRFVTQPAHAALAGQFADGWGNGVFERPEPFASVAIAAYRHDDGWRSYDSRPHLKPDGTPVDFIELPADAWIALYEDGIDSVVGLDAYAGLLVSMHGAGLRRRRYGLSPGWPDTPAAYEDFVAEQESLQRRLARELLAGRQLSESDGTLLSTLHERGEPAAGQSGELWRNYQLLQAWDVLSLAFCTTVSPPGYDAVGPVPTGEGGREETLTIEPLGDDEFRVEPYPFDVDPLRVAVPARTVRRDAFQDEEGVVRAYYRAPLERIGFALRG